MNKVPKDYDYLVFIAMIYIAIDLSSMVFAYKIIEIYACITQEISISSPPKTCSIMSSVVSASV